EQTEESVEGEGGPREECDERAHGRKGQIACDGDPVVGLFGGDRPATTEAAAVDVQAAGHGGDDPGDEDDHEQSADGADVAGGQPDQEQGGQGQLEQGQRVADEFGERGREEVVGLDGFDGQRGWELGDRCGDEDRCQADSAGEREPGLDGAPTKASATGLTGDCVCCVDHLGLRGWGLVERALFVSARRTALRVRYSAYCVIRLGAYHMWPQGRAVRSSDRLGPSSPSRIPQHQRFRNRGEAPLTRFLPSRFFFEPYGKAVGRSGRGRPTAGAGHRARTPAANSWAKERTAVRAVSRSGASSTR